ncbi:MAG: MFS transporter [Candidatus Gracilibacteria bacterium]
MSELAIISADKELSPIRERNLFLNTVVSNLIWMIFHFSVFFFFTFQLKSVALVGFFLGIGNLFSFLLDIPIGIIQKYFRPKTLFIISYISEIIAMLIFINFTLQISDFIKDAVTPDNMGIITTALEFFLGNGFNIFLLLIASFCYGLTKELQEVTLISYILNNANHNQYISLLAQKNIATGIGAFLGLILAGIILTFNENFIIFLTIFIIILIIYFTLNFFDNSEKTITLQDIYKFRVLFDKNNLKNMSLNIKDSAVRSVTKIELKNIINNSKYIFLKPLTIKSGLNFKMLLELTKKEFIITYKVLTNINNPIIIYWTIVIFITFSFWDTFASTFLIKYLDSLWQGKGYFLLGIIAIPAFGLQGYFSKLSDKFGIPIISNIGLVLSGLSLLLMGIFSDSKNVLLILGLAIINSIGYAACMTLSQAGFLEFYNKAFASYNNLKEIDANASAAPLKLLQNLANVLGLFFGGIILTELSYMGFFIIFGIVIIYILYWAIKNHVTDEKEDTVILSDSEEGTLTL